MAWATMVAAGQERVFFKFHDVSHHTGSVYTCAWNCDGTSVATGAGDATAAIWSVDHTGCPRDRPEKSLKGHNKCVDSLSWHPKKRNVIATCSRDDKWVGVWDADTGKLLVKIRTPGGNWQVLWRPDGEEIATLTRVNMVNFMDTEGTQAPRVHTAREEINQIAWSKSGDLFITTTRSGADVFAYPGMRPLRSLQGHNFSVFTLAVDPTDRLLATGGMDGSVALWSLDEMYCTLTVAVSGGAIRAVCFSPDGRRAAFLTNEGRGEGKLYVVSTATGEVLFQHDVQDSAASVAWHPRKGTLAIAARLSKKLLVATPTDEPPKERAASGGQAANAEPARPFASLLHRALDAPPFDPYRRPPPRDHPFMPAAARPLDRYAPPAAPVPPSRRGVPDGRFVGDPAYARGPPPGMYAGGGGHVMPPSRGGAMPGAGMYGSGPPRQMR